MAIADGESAETPQAEPQATPEASPAPETPAPSRTITFFERLKRIAADDWGTRAVIYLYRQEPITDRLRSGNVVFIMKYDEPVDQEKILIDHGSGKYKAVLTFRKPGAKESDQIDSTIFEMLNVSFPPKIPPGEWVNDPRNKKWAWAKPLMPPTAAEQQQQQRSGDETLVGAYRLVKDIYSDARDEVKAQQPPPQPAVPVTDPLLTGLSIAEKFMAMKADNPMVDILRDELKHSRERIDRLSDELRSKENQAPAKSGLGSLKDMIADAQSIGILPADIKSLWGKAEGALQAVTRSRMSGTEEFWQPIVVGIAEAIKPVLPMVVARMVTPKPPQPQQPGQPPQSPALPAAAPAGTQPLTNGAPAGTQPPTNGAPAVPTDAATSDFNPQQAFAFIKAFADPFIRWFKEGIGSGSDFAEWIYDGHGPDWQGLKWLHMKTTVGTEPIVQMFRQSPFWPEIAAAETKFQEYVRQFVEWQPEAAQAVVDVEEDETAEAN